MVNQIEISKILSAQCSHGNAIRKSLYTAIIFLVGGFLFIDCNKNSTDATPGNTPPVAAFNVIPESGSTQGYFILDPSTCSDAEDSTINILARWDWENDAIWDTEYLANQMVTHQYTAEGTKTIKLEIMDTGGLTDTTTRSIMVTAVIRDTGRMTDIDGHVYRTIKIGDQWWMAENLKVTRYRTGEALANVTDLNQWIGLSSGAYCDYGNHPANALIYGRLYNWYAASDSSNIAPEGWHVPSDDEWKTLERFHGMSPTETERLGWRGAYEGGKMKEAGTSHWYSPNLGAADLFGFSALPGGYRDFYGYRDIGRLATFWSLTGYDDNIRGWCRFLFNTYTTVYRSRFHKYNAFSIRCVKD